MEGERIIYRYLQASVNMSFVAFSHHWSRMAMVWQNVEPFT